MEIEETIIEIPKCESCGKPANKQLTLKHSGRKLLLCNKCNKWDTQEQTRPEPERKEETYLECKNKRRPETIKREKEILELLEEKGPMTLSKIHYETGEKYKKSLIRNTLNRLNRKKIIESTQKSKGINIYKKTEKWKTKPGSGETIKASKRHMKILDAIRKIGKARVLQISKELKGKYDKNQIRSSLMRLEQINEINIDQINSRLNVYSIKEKKKEPPEKKGKNLDQQAKDWVYEFIKKEQRPPTLNELKTEFGLSIYTRRYPDIKGLMKVQDGKQQKNVYIPEDLGKILTTDNNNNKYLSKQNQEQLVWEITGKDPTKDKIRRIKKILEERDEAIRKKEIDKELGIPDKKKMTKEDMQRIIEEGKIKIPPCYKKFIRSMLGIAQTKGKFDINIGGFMGMIPWCGEIDERDAENLMDWIRRHRDEIETLWIQEGRPGRIEITFYKGKNNVYGEIKRIGEE